MSNVNIKLTRRMWTLTRHPKPEDIIFSVVASVPNTYEALSITWIDSQGLRTIPVPCLFMPLPYRQLSDSKNWVAVFFLCWVGKEEIYDSSMRLNLQTRNASHFHAVLSDRRYIDTEDLKVWTRI